MDAKISSTAAEEPDAEWLLCEAEPMALEAPNEAEPEDPNEAEPYEAPWLDAPYEAPWLAENDEPDDWN